MAWLEKKKRWLRKETTNVPVADDATGYSVLYTPIRCPRCKSKNIRCYVTRPPVRYHTCKNCGVNFKSVELDV